MSKNLEIRTITHKGIAVSIKIDYDKGEVSLVDQKDNYKGKQWLFTQRGLEYMNGWLDVLSAMTFAVEEGKKELEANLGEKSRFSEAFINKMTDNSPCPFCDIHSNCSQHEIEEFSDVNFVRGNK
jgi:hypothetical protein